jgi:hypothetical protein
MPTIRCRRFSAVNKVMQLQIGDAERAAILGGNAARALRL